jgi:hypothetical protein
MCFPEDSRMTEICTEIVLTKKQPSLIWCIMTVEINVIQNYGKLSEDTKRAKQIFV